MGDLTKQCKWQTLVARPTIMWCRRCGTVLALVSDKVMIPGGGDPHTDKEWVPSLDECPAFADNRRLTRVGAQLALDILDEETGRCNYGDAYEAGINITYERVEKALKEMA